MWARNELGLINKEAKAVETYIIRSVRLKRESTHVTQWLTFSKGYGSLFKSFSHHFYEVYVLITSLGRQIWWFGVMEKDNGDIFPPTWNPERPQQIAVFRKNKDLAISHLMMSLSPYCKGRYDMATASSWCIKKSERNVPYCLRSRYWFQGIKTAEYLNGS